MYELIVDCTNRCVLNCRYCGTDSNSSDEQYLDYDTLEYVLKVAKSMSICVYLGGGCFFCHPNWKEILELNLKLNCHIIVDVPLDEKIFCLIQQYPPEKYNYTVSVSLWGIGEIHNQLSRTQHFILFEKYKELLKSNMRVSFVITNELIDSYSDVIDFINNNKDIKFYFHRLMPTGRCKYDDLPDFQKIMNFKNEVVSNVNCKDILRFHHTLLSETFDDCKAYRDRLFIDYKGNIYGCGWVSSNVQPIGFIKQSNLREMIFKAISGDYNGLIKCPLMQQNELLTTL